MVLAIVMGIIVIIIVVIFAINGSTGRERGSGGFSWGKLILIVLIVIAALWAYGFFRAMFEAHKGVSLLEISMHYDAHNFITAHGYKCYFSWFTNAPARAGEISNDLSRLLNSL